MKNKIITGLALAGISGVANAAPPGFLFPGGARQDSVIHAPNTSLDGKTVTQWGATIDANTATAAAAVPKSWIGANTTSTVTGVAGLDSNGNLTQPLLNNARVGGADVGTDVSQAVSAAATGGYTRALEDHFSDVINVKDFGAKCDVGVASTPTDDTAAINAAFVYAQTKAYPVITFPGMCSISSTIKSTVGNHLTLQGGGLLVNGTNATDGIDLTMSGVGKIAVRNMRFKPGANGANRPLSVIGNGGDIAGNSDFFEDITVTTSDESMSGIGFNNGLYLYGLVSYIHNLTVTFPQMVIVDGKQTMISYTDPTVGAGLTLAGTPADATNVLDGGGSLVSNMQGNGGFTDIKFVGMSQGGVFNTIGSNWQTHIVYAGTDAVSPQTFTFESPSSQTGWWSVNDAVLFDFEIPSGQIIINNGLFNGPSGTGNWTVLKCPGCKTVQFTNNQVDQNYPSSTYLLDSGSVGAGATGWVIQNNTFGAPNTFDALNGTKDTLNFAGLNSGSELVFTGNKVGLIPPIVAPPLLEGSGNNLVTSSGNSWTSAIRKTSTQTLHENTFTQGPLSSDWSIDTMLHGSGSVTSSGYVTLTLDGNEDSKTNALSTLRPYNTVGNVESLDAYVYCYEWGDNPAKYYSLMHTVGMFSVVPGATDTYALLGQSSTTTSSLLSNGGEVFTSRFVLSPVSNSPALQVVNTGTATATLTCSASVKLINIQ